MDTVFSIAGVVDTERPVQGILDMTDAGFQWLMPDLGIFAPAQVIGKKRFRSDLAHRFYEKFMEEAGKKFMKMPVMKMPFLLADTRRTDVDQLFTQVGQDCVRTCEEHGCEQLLVQPLPSCMGRDGGWEKERIYYLTLAEQCKKEGTKILLINRPAYYNGRPTRGIYSDGETAGRMIDVLNSEVGMERFGFCLDTGSCNLCKQDMQAFAMALGKRLLAVILTENNGRDAARLLPFTAARNLRSTVDWLGLIRGLRGSGFDGHLILEAEDTIQALSPLLRPHILSLCKAVADYFLLQANLENTLKKYRSIALFGAGNMCRNYMKCYGAVYPPLFTCDNNQALWGTSFCGLEVKSPEALKDLPDDCGVFICNLYYREIEAQLRAMGVKHIEYFNDEYMSSYYFDRFHREESGEIVSL